MLRKVFFLLLFAFSFSSCQKILEHYNHHGSKPSTNCQIKTASNSHDVTFDTTRFFYHSNGLPAYVQFASHNTEFDFIDSFTLYYQYDHLDRLIAETSEWVYGPSLVYYAYEGNSRLPVRDTIRALYSSCVEDLEYDALGRLIKKTRRDFEYVIPEADPGTDQVEVYRYYYDLRGNRQEHSSNPGYHGLIQYSDKPSLYSLNPVWQLIYKDYSRNSVPFGETFNSDGLPLSIKTGDIPRQAFLSVGAGSKIEYDCGE